MAQAVRERTEEIGVLKSIGFTNERVLALVLAESCLIAAAGGLTGLTLIWLATLGGSPVPQMFPVFYLPTRYLAIGAGLVFAVNAASYLLVIVALLMLRTRAMFPRERRATGHGHLMVAVRYASGS